MNILIFSMFSLLIAVATLGMFVYNQLVSFRHDMRSEQASLGQREVENADLKNELYRTMDPKGPALLAENQSLVVDQNPEYITVSSRVSSLLGASN